jgi:intein/homing endonuclease
VVAKRSAASFEITPTPVALAAALAVATDEIREQFRPPANTLFLHSKQMEVYASKHRFKVVVAGRRWGKCLHTGSMIEMADGTQKPIEQIAPGDMVLTANEDTYKVQPRCVVAVESNGVKETVVVKTAGRSLRSTPHHPILANNTWINAGDLKVGDLVAVPKRLAFGASTLPDHVVDILAIWLAEGNNYTISNTTPEILDAVRRAACAFGKDLTVTSKGGVDWIVSNGDKTGGPQAGSKNPMRIMLEGFGLWGKTSKTKFVPDAVFGLNEGQLARFLNLFFACDGCICKRAGKTWAIEVGLANERMTRQVASLLHKFGIRTQIKHKVHAECSSVTGVAFESWRLIASDSTSIIAFATKIGALSKEKAVSKALDAALRSAGSSNSYLPISHDDFVGHLSYTPKEAGKYGGYNCAVARDLPEELRQGLTSWRKQTPTRMSVRRYEALRGFSDGHFGPIVDGDIAWEEVKSVEKADSVQTWDLSIEGNHNFIANGIVVHNTQLAKICLIKFARKPKRLIWYVAPSYRMAKQIMWPDLVEAIPRSWVRKYNETILTITLVNGSRIELKGADNPDTLRGVGIHYLVMDEVQDITPDAWKKVLRPTLASTGGHALFIGCVNCKTKVLGRHGAMGIESLSIGSSDKVLDSLDVDLYGLDRTFHKADGFWNNGMVNTKKIKTHMGFEMESSLPHPIWTVGADGKECWKKTEEITPGDRVAIARGMEVWGGQDPLKGWGEHAAVWREQFKGKQGPQPTRLQIE